MLSNISGRIEYDIRTYRNHRTEQPALKTSLCTAAGSATGTVIPMIFFAKKQHKKLFSISFGLKEMVLTSAGAIFGGLVGGIIGGKKEHKKQKINEGVFQFMNATVPTCLTASVFAIAQKVKTFNKPMLKIPAVLLSLIGGMHLAAKISNKINDPYDKIPDRKLTLKDSVANLDDAIGVFVLAKIPIAEKLQAEKALPVIYSWCGYRAGMSN